MALNFLSHLIKIAKNILGIIYLPHHHHHHCNLLCTLSNFCRWLFCFIYSMSSEWRHLSFLQQLFQPFWPNQIYSVIQNSSHQPFLLHWLPFAAYPHLSSCPFHLYKPFLVLRCLCLALLAYLYCFCHLILKFLHSKSSFYSSAVFYIH